MNIYTDRNAQTHTLFYSFKQPVALYRRWTSTLAQKSSLQENLSEPQQQSRPLAVPVPMSIKSFKALEAQHCRPIQRVYYVALSGNTISTLFQFPVISRFISIFTCSLYTDSHPSVPFR